MIVVDLCVMSILMLFIESRILKEKYILLSPYALAQFALLYIYILPTAFYRSTTIFNIIQRLDNSAVEAFLINFRIFYYLFCLLSIFSFIEIRRRKLPKNALYYELSSQFLLISILVLFLIVFFAEMFIVRFNVSVLIDKMINPRRYTFFREGLGMFTHAANFSKIMLVFLSILYRKQKKTFLSTIFVILAILFNLLGGSKSSLLLAVIFAMVIFQKTSSTKIYKFSRMLPIAILIFVVAIVSFMIMSTENDQKTLSGAIESIIRYSGEAYYSARVITDFQWDIRYVGSVVEGLVFTPIPRSIFPEKDFYGLYPNYWKPFYQPNSAKYHTSTYGFLAEAHMLFPFVGPLLYAFMFNLLFKIMYVSFFRTRSLSALFFLSYLFTYVYFLMRTGLFMPTSFWIMIIYYVSGRLFFLIGNSLNIKSTNDRDKLLRS